MPARTAYFQKLFCKKSKLLSNTQSTASTVKSDEIIKKKKSQKIKEFLNGRRENFLSVFKKSEKIKKEKVEEEKISKKKLWNRFKKLALFNKKSKMQLLNKDEKLVCCNGEGRVSRTRSSSLSGLKNIRLSLPIPVRRTIFDGPRGPITETKNEINVNTSIGLTPNNKIKQKKNKSNNNHNKHFNSSNLCETVSYDFEEYDTCAELIDCSTEESENCANNTESNNNLKKVKQ